MAQRALYIQLVSVGWHWYDQTMLVKEQTVKKFRIRLCPGVHLVSEECDETFGFSLQVQVHVEQLPIQSLVNLLLPLRPTGLLHGPLHTLPVQVTGQMTKENAHVLCVVQSNAELAESKEEPKRKKQRAEVEKQEGKEAGLEKSGWIGCKFK